MRISIHIGPLKAILLFASPEGNPKQRRPPWCPVPPPLLPSVESPRFSVLPGGAFSGYPPGFFACESRRQPRRQYWSCSFAEKGFPRSPAAWGCPATGRYGAAAFGRRAQFPSEDTPACWLGFKISFLSKSPMV